MKKTLVQILFGDDTTLKMLTTEQIYNRVARYIAVLKMTDEQRKEFYKKNMEKYREAHGEDYKKYQREYRSERRVKDEEFRKRTNKHSNKWKEKQDEQSLQLHRTHQETNDGG